MQKIKLNDNLEVDLSKLIESRLLIQANSGGGKSWAIRRLIEQSFGKVQIIVLDPEGEFTNLRQKYDFVFAGKDGDAPAESRSAALLARRLLELKASAIVDLYELPPQERKHFVRLFCEAMVNAPKELWHDCLIIIDEAHVFAPEKGESEAMGPVIDLATRGRKRGYCVVLATQRLPKLNKDAAAECNNKLIGRASQDIDRKRAAEELGFTTKEQILSLRDLSPGEFYAFGPAISRDVIKTTIGDLVVKPAPRGAARHVPPPPTDKIKKILSQLADLPQEAKREVETIQSLKARVRELEGAVRKPAADPKTVERAVKEAVEANTKAFQLILANRDEDFQRGLDAIKEDIVLAQKKLKERAKKTAPVFTTKVHIITPEQLAPGAVIPSRQVVVGVDLGRGPNDKSVVVRGYKKDDSIIIDEVGTINSREQKILDAIAWLESITVPPTPVAVAFLAGYTVSGNFNNLKGGLRSKGFITYPTPGTIALTETGGMLARFPIATPTQDELHDKVKKVLGERLTKLLQPVIDAYPGDLSVEELAQAAGYEVSGNFNNLKGKLRTLGLIEYPSPGRIKASSILFI